MTRHAFLTPSSALLTSDVTRRSLCLPGELWYLLDGASQALCQEWNWEEHGTATPKEMAEYFTEKLSEWRDCMMIGTVLPFATNDLPENVLPCDGSMYESADYPELSSVIHTDLLRGRGSFFVTPDMRDRFILGEGAELLSQTGGESEHTLTESEIPNHSHQYTPPVMNLDLEAPGVPDILGAGIGVPQQTQGAGGGEPHNNMPPYYVLKYGIVCR